MTRAEPINCLYCRTRHMPRFLCDPAKAYLDAVHAKAGALTMPTMEMSKPAPVLGAGEHPGDDLVRQLVVQGCCTTVAGVIHPGLVFTGLGLNGRLPQWTYVGADFELRAVAKLVHDMAEMAIRRADGANGATG